MGLPASGPCAETIPSFPPCHCLVHTGWYEHKELREDISAQVACHISVTFTCQNNSRLPLAPMSVSSFCLSHAFVLTVEEIYLEPSQTKHHRPKAHVCVCMRVIAAMGLNLRAISFVWTGCLFGYVQEDLLRMSLAQDLAQGVETSCLSSMTLRQWSWRNTLYLPEMFNPVHSQTTIAGINNFIIYNKRRILHYLHYIWKQNKIRNSAIFILKYEVCTSVSITCEIQHISFIY